VNWRTRKVAALVVAACVLAGIAWNRHLASVARDEQLRHVMRMKAQAFKQEVDRRFPPGTSLAEFDVFANQQTGWRSKASDGWYISIGQEPSGVWYCGPREVGVVATFSAERLTSTSVSSWGLNCL